jgi:hypothetical protein
LWLRIREHPQAEQLHNGKKSLGNRTHLRCHRYEKASSRAGAFHDFYQGLLRKGMKPAMARLTLARKIAVITLTEWSAVV